MIESILINRPGALIKIHDDNSRSLDPAGCDHIHWAIRGRDTMGYGYCFDCRNKIELAVLFDNLRVRMENALNQTARATSHDTQQPSDQDQD